LDLLRFLNQCSDVLDVMTSSSQLGQGVFAVRLPFVQSPHIEISLFAQLAVCKSMLAANHCGFAAFSSGANMIHHGSTFNTIHSLPFCFFICLKNKGLPSPQWLCRFKPTYSQEY
jgi:hypothetical protein